MNNSHSLLIQKRWRFIDHTSLGPSFSALQSFATDDTLCHTAGLGLTDAVARAWVHHDTIVLGIQDGRLPFIKEGVLFLNELGQNVIIRNSGGLAVVLDEGVLNLSLVFTEEQKKIEIDKGYNAMYELIQYMFKDFDVSIEAREIVGSYCPGSYDLSIEGKKFAGISQRRIRKGVAVQIYICVTGSGAERATMIKRFYDLAKQDAVTKFDYPNINPTVMASLSELLEVDMTVEEVVDRLLNALEDHGEHVYEHPLSEQENELYETYLQRIKERNEIVRPV